MRESKAWALIAPLTILLSATALAAPAPPPEDPAPAASSSRAPTLLRDLEGYSDYLNRIDVHVTTVTNEFQRVAQMMQQPDGSTPQGLARIDREAAALITRASAGQAALRAEPIPDTSRLTLEEEMQPASLRTQYSAMLEQFGTLAGNIRTLVRAVQANDEAAARTALAGLGQTGRIIIDGEIVRLRARQAAAPREHSDWEYFQTQIVSARVALRLATATLRGVDGTIDPRLSADMGAFADQFEQSAERGDGAIAATDARITRDLAAARARGDTVTIQLYEREQRAVARQAGVFSVARAMAAELRQPGSGANAAQQLLQRLRPLRMQLDGHVREVFAEINPSN